MSETFKLKLVKSAPRKIKLTTGTFMLIGTAIYKGPFATQAEIEAISANNGDYADCYETGTRWQYQNGAWTDTKIAIPVDGQYVSQHETSSNATPNSVVRYTESGNIVIARPTRADEAASKEYVDELGDRVTDVENAIENPTLIITAI